MSILKSQSKLKVIAFCFLIGMVFMVLLLKRSYVAEVFTQIKENIVNLSESATSDYADRPLVLGNTIKESQIKELDQSQRQILHNEKLKKQISNSLKKSKIFNSTRPETIGADRKVYEMNLGKLSVDKETLKADPNSTTHFGDYADLDMHEHSGITTQLEQKTFEKSTN